MEKSGRKIKKKELTIILIILFLIIILIPIFLFPEIIGYIIREQKELKNQVEFYFYDETSNCPFDGYVFVGDKLVGKTEQGFFNLAYANYIENFQDNENISLFGKLGNCFNEYEGFYYDKYWKSFKIEKYYFDGESTFNFKTKVTVHNPAKRELMGFVQAEEVSSELNEISLEQKILSDLSSINLHLNDKIAYVKDWDFNKEMNYWQTPLETLELEQGDCEDYSSTLLSLFLAYDNSLNCYNVIFSSHVTTFCKIGNYYAYFDQEKTELKKEITNRNELRPELAKLKDDYFEYYGINNSERVHYAFNDNQFIEFNSKEDFINWQYALAEKEEFDIFEKFEQQAFEIRKKYPIQDLELATEKPETKLPTLRGFFRENFIMIISFIGIFIVLVVVLIVISRIENF